VPPNLQNIDQSSKFFYWRTPRQICDKSVIKYLTTS